MFIKNELLPEADFGRQIFLLKNFGLNRIITSDPVFLPAIFINTPGFIISS